MTVSVITDDFVQLSQVFLSENPLFPNGGTRLNIAIIDDVQTDLESLRTAVETYYNSRQTDVQLHCFSSLADFKDTYVPGKYDLMFLDIYMDSRDELDTGMDIARKIRQQKDSCALIFVTSSDAFAVASYDVQASYYLLKPFDPVKLSHVLDSIEIKHAQKIRYIEVICDRTPVRVPIKTILYADTFHNAVHLHTDAGVLRTYLTFQKFEELIRDLPCFLSCYRGCLVNMDRILKTSEDGFLLDNQETVQIRKRGANAIKKAYLDYLFSDAIH